MNWLWARPGNLTLDDWKRLFEKCNSNNIRAVFLESYNGHKCFFEHPTLPVVRPLLEELIEISADFNIEIHAWMWTMICNNPEIIANHPDWYSVNGNGEPAHTHPAYVGYYRFMCPRHPEVRAFVKGNVEALASIDGLAGIQLDYVRQPDVILAEALQPKYNIVQDKEYPEYDYCYNEICKKGFKDLTGYEPHTGIEDPDMYQKWLQYRMDGVTEMVNEYLAPAARAGGKFISAAVFPNWQSVRQQWMKWDLDAFFPMLYHGFYNEDYEWVYQQTALLKSMQEYGRPIYSGLFLPHIEKDDLRDVMKGCIEAGASGCSLFDAGGWK